MKAKHALQEEEPSTTKKAKVVRTVPRHVLDAFDNLVPDDAAGQAKASVVILKYVDQLISSQSGYNLPDDVVYVVKRLVSGLVSNRQRVREGFCSTLQGLLQLQPTTVSLTYQLLQEFCENKKNISNEEQRNYLTGELLGYGALIRSGHVKNNASMREEIIKRLFLLREKKQIYDIIISHFIVHIMEKFTKSFVNQEILFVLNQELSIPIEELTPCKLWLRLVILRKFPETADASFRDTLKPKNFSTISNIIVKTAIDMPNVHPCLGEVISSLADQKSTGSKSQVVQFWVTGLVPFLKEAATNCLQLLFNALQLVLLKVKTAEEVRQVCNGDVINHLVNVMSLHNKNLSASARGVGSALLQLATTNYEQDNSVQLTVAKLLIEKPGSVCFDQVTGTKLLAQMRLQFTPATVISVSKILKKIVNTPDEEIRKSNKIGSALFLGKLVAQPKMNAPEHDCWKKKQLIFLMSLALLEPENKQTLQEYQDVFFKCLGSQMSRIKEYRATLHYLLEEANKTVQASKDTEKPHISAKVRVAWDKIISRLAEMQKGNKLPTVAIDVFQVLYMQMALYLLADIKTTEIIEELDSCYKAAKKERKKDIHNGESDTIYELSWVEMVAELLLALLPHENNLLRSMVQGVFWLLCPLMTPVALTSIVDVLDPAKQDHLIKMEDEQSEDEEEEDDDEEDEEEEDVDDEEDIEEDADDEEDNEGDGEESDEDTESQPEEDGILNELKKDMLTVVGDIEDEVDMDSVPQEELDNVNKKLGKLMHEYLKSRKKKSLRRKGVEILQSDERSLMHYRSRVCDLLELYIKESPDMGLVLSLVNPLITAIQAVNQDRKRQEDLLNRIRRLLYVLGKVQKFTNNGEATVESVVEEFNSFFSVAVKMHNEFNPTIRDCYFLFMRCGLQLLGEEAHNQDNMVIQSYLSHLREIFTEKKYNLRTQNFTEVCLKDCGGLWCVAELMKDYSFNTKFKCYWRTQAMQILIKLYRNDGLISRVDSKTIVALEKDLSTNICQTLDPSAPLGSINGQYLANICELLFVIHKKETLKNLPCGINWEEIGSVLVTLRHRITSKTFKICRGHYNSIINRLCLSKLVVKAQVNTKKTKAETSSATPNNAIAETSSATPNDAIAETSSQKESKKEKKKNKANLNSEEKVAKLGIKRKQKAGNTLENDVQSIGKVTSNQPQKKKKEKRYR